ncbi:cytochrome c3 family protein [Neptunicella sp. SCSIO 80796]|uniref:cytochrome c3 family protein n=1 Tax=Neptunicella plasticusilytica TaxID=3117012 RepID=UPI003A4D94AF
MTPRIFITLLFLVFFQSQASETKDYSVQACTSCHQQQHQLWLKSDHAKAMAEASKETVLADFNNIEVSHFDEHARFYQKDGQYWADIGQGNKLQRYQVQYTFGHFPLQQYLVEIAPGKLQVIPFSWDARPAEQGGQRWYHNYADENITTEDRLHWLQPLQNWNGMCADCHSDGLQRHYSPADDSFATEWKNINVGCLSCHGEMPNHPNSSAPQKTSSASAYIGNWLRKADQKIASWHGPKRNNQFMDSCFACHSLRSPLTDGFSADNAFLDQFSPQLLLAPMYHADGQIKEEVYVYGSFLQSKMFAAGVNCLDCHDQHSMKIKIQGNGLCLQCHSPEVYNVESHHHHPQQSEGAQCISCHMPEQRYMGVDDRRDHSFKIPRPQLAEQFGTPDACSTCHQDKDSQWAKKQLTAWFGQPSPISTNLHNLYALQAGQPIDINQHQALIKDDSIPVISRATAITLLAMTQSELDSKFISTLLGSDEALFRLSAAQVASILPAAEKARLLGPLLDDQYKAVRVAAARSLVGVSLSGKTKAAYNRAFDELITSLKVNSWRGEGHANQAAIHIELNQLDKAAEQFRQSISNDPYFPGSYLGLAEVYRLQQQQDKLDKLYHSALERLPESAELHYSYALYQVRKQQYTPALASFKKAYQLMPDNSQYFYAYLLSMDGTGQSRQALNTLKMLFSRFKGNQQLLELGLYLAQKNQDRQSYNWFMQNR